MLKQRWLTGGTFPHFRESTKNRLSLKVHYFISIKYLNKNYQLVILIILVVLMLKQRWLTGGTFPHFRESTMNRLSLKVHYFISIKYLNKNYQLVILTILVVLMLKQRWLTGGIFPHFRESTKVGESAAWVAIPTLCCFTMRNMTLAHRK